MPKKVKRSRPPRPHQIVMRELVGDNSAWDLNGHLKACLAAYQSEPGFGNAVFFAFEAISGIAEDVELRAKAGKLDPALRDEEWLMSPFDSLEVPFIWISALAAGW